jgi:hypothetical protein
MGLSFTITAGPRQRSHSQVRVPQDSWPHFSVSDSRLPQLGGPSSRIYIPQEQGGPVIPRGTGFPFRRLLQLAEARWRYLTPPPHGIKFMRKISILYIPAACFMLVFYWFLETSAEFHQATLCIPPDRTPHDRCFVTLKSKIVHIYVKETEQMCGVCFGFLLGTQGRPCSFWCPFLTRMPAKRVQCSVVDRKQTYLKFCKVVKSRSRCPPGLRPFAHEATLVAPPLVALLLVAPIL